MLTAESTYAGYVVGHPGYPGGVPQRPAGFGLTFGEKDLHETEFWLTEANGLAGSAEWEQRTADPSIADGAWLLDVRGKARSITLTGTLVGANKAAVARSVSEAGSVFSVAPRSGWLRWESSDGTNRRIPVALTGQVKTDFKGDRWVTMEFQFRGINTGTPGQGVFMEAESWSTSRPDNSSPGFVELEGVVPSPPKITFTGPMDAGASIQISDYEVTLTQDISEGERLTVDTVNYRVTLFDSANESSHARPMVTFKDGRWPVCPVGAVPLLANWQGSGFITLEVLGLW